MKYLVVPAEVKIPNTPEGSHYSFFDFLDELVWDALRKSEFDLFDSASDKFETRTSGNTVDLTDLEHEAIWKILTAMDLPPSVARRIKPYLKAFKNATNQLK